MAFIDWLVQNSVRPAFWFQPAFYTFHGWLATEMALWMLFHPYEPKFLPGTKLQLPFTPGIFPRGRHKLSISIADTITTILLTEQDIKKQAEKLITEENIYKALDMLFDSIGAELRDITQIRRIYHAVENLVPPLLEKLVNGYIIGLESGNDQSFDTVLEQLFNRILPHLSISESQAEIIAKTLFDTALTPPSVRQVLIEVLTTENIDLLEEGIRNSIGGVQGFLMRFLDVKKGFYQFRNFMIDEPVEAEKLLVQMMEHLALQERLKQYVLKFSPQQLPSETMTDLKSTVIESSRRMLIAHREEVAQALCNLSEEATQSITSNLMHVDYKKLAENWLPGFKRDLAHFTYTYLDKELENMLSRALPAISLNSVIVDKIDQFSARELEETIQRICHHELRWLAFLGAFLGLWLGLVSNVMGYWVHPIQP